MGEGKRETEKANHKKLIMKIENKAISWERGEPTFEWTEISDWNNGCGVEKHYKIALPCVSDTDWTLLEKWFDQAIKDAHLDHP